MIMLSLLGRVYKVGVCPESLRICTRDGGSLEGCMCREEVGMKLMALRCENKGLIDAWVICVKLQILQLPIFPRDSVRGLNFVILRKSNRHHPLLTLFTTFSETHSYISQENSLYFDAAVLVASIV